MSKDRQGMLLGFGISSMITMQAIINIGVISGTLPTKGIPAPFISYGGSNLMMSIVCVGLLLSIAMDSGQSQDGVSDGQVKLKNKGSENGN
jgi:cell division protein FtsW